MVQRAVRTGCVIAWISITLLLLATPATAQESQQLEVLFMHHSTGEGLIWQGAVREGLTALGYAFWDHGYNEEGLTDSAGNLTGTNWNVPDDNTDPDGWYAIFNQPVTDPPANVFSHMLQADVIAFKSCFPASNITDEEMFRQYQQYYLSIRDVMDRHPDKIFIPFTTPPLVPNETDFESAQRARRWAEYLTSDEYLSGHPNVFVFDFFNLLADEQGYLRAAYRGDEWDSHPNEVANRTIGPLFVTFIDQAVREFQPGLAPIPGVQVIEVDRPDEDEIGPVEDDEYIPDGEWQGAALPMTFEPADSLEGWWEFADDGVQFVFAQDSGGSDGGMALRLAFDIPAGRGAGCGVELVADASWAVAQGISFDWRSDQPGHVLRVALAVWDPAQVSPETGEATPFEVELLTEGAEWSSVTIRWDDLSKVEWVTEGMDHFDPARVTWIAFDLGHWDHQETGSIWIDNLQIVP